MKSGCQIYVKGSLEAAALYQKAFNLTKGMTAYNEDGTFEHVSLMSGENEIVAVAEDSVDWHNDKIVGNKCPVMSFNIYELGTREAVDQAYKVLSEEARFNENPGGPEIAWWDDSGTVYSFGLMDKFGVQWGVMI